MKTRYALWLLCAAATAQTVAAKSQDQGTQPEYVSLGSSFAAGAGIGPIQAGSPPRCSRTVNNYASLLAKQLRLSLDDQSCGGARAEHILTPWNELPAQIDAVRSTTRLVTVTVGGNDLNYVGNLIMAGCRPERGLEFQGKTMPCQPVRAPSPQDYEALKAKLVQIASEARRRAPRATVIFVQYLSLVNDKACPQAPITGQNAQILRTQAEQLAAATGEAAHASGALILPMDRASRHHTPCDGQPWANGAPSGAYDPTKPAPWHPNVAGHESIAAALSKLVSGALRHNAAS